ncbi:MAG: RNA methyltransferase [bacterium]|nr:RNA methyltransferase [bacterium]
MKKRGHSELVVFGRRAVVEALQQGRDDIEVSDVWVAKTVAGVFRRELALLCRERGIDLQVGTLAQVRSLSGEPRYDQGVVARIRFERVIEVEAYLETRKGRAARHPVRLIALDGVTNSQNVGMVVRTLVACGLQGILWPMIGSPWINGLVIKASAAAIYHCNILRCETLALGLLALKGAGFEVIGLAHPSGSNLFDCELPHRAIFVAGSETKGLSDEVAELLDRRVEIPLAGPVESLNVAVAASLACYRAAGAISGLPPNDSR